MKSVVEYEVWSTPGRNLPAEYGKSLELKMRKSGIPEEAFLGLFEVPDKSDSEGLRVALSRGDVKIEDFYDFSRSRGLTPDVDEPASAAQFLEYFQGRPLAWIHIAEEEDKALLEKIMLLLNAEDGIVIR